MPDPQPFREKNYELDIAVVGMACRFPGARNLEEFWHNLVEGVESITKFSDEELLRSGVPAAWLSDPNYVKAAPILEDPGQFDADFFGFLPSEARTIDPQHRILLELAHEAIERELQAGIRFAIGGPLVAAAIALTGLEQFERAAILLGAGRKLMPGFASDRTQQLVSRTELILVEQLGRARYDTLRRQGAELGLDDAIATLATTLEDTR